MADQIFCQFTGFFSAQVLEGATFAAVLIRNNGDSDLRRAVVVQNCSQHAKFILMPDEQDILALEAIEAVARQGLKRYRLLLGGILAVIVVLLAIVFYLPDRQAKSPVAVLLPKMDTGAVKDNAKRQWEGFQHAFEKNKVSDSNRHVYHFNYPLSIPDDRDAIINQIKDWYDRGIRTFIITMSGAVTDIKKDFTDWADTLPSNDRPVLVATVASAPGIVEREKGVFRHYIRSEDESGMLATVAESLHAAEVHVFFVNDAYGDKAQEILFERLRSNTTTFSSSSVEVKFNPEEEDKIKLVVDEILGKTASSKNTVVVIVGYGPMIIFTLETLRKAKKIDNNEVEHVFEGDILVVSTFTEKIWRPTDLKDEHILAPGIKPFDERIHTVGPVHIKPSDQDKKPGVVYQFSYLTLDRALHCKDTRGIEEFWSCWNNVEDYNEGYLEAAGVKVEFTANGDSHVSLRLLNKDQW